MGRNNLAARVEESCGSGQEKMRDEVLSRRPRECRIPFKTDLGLTIRCGPIDGLQVEMEKQREKSWPSAEGPERGVKQSSYSSTKNGEDIIVVALGRPLSLVNVCQSNHRCSRHIWQWPIVVWN